jgi:hypothetical protein
MATRESSLSVHHTSLRAIRLIDRLDEDDPQQA